MTYLVMAVAAALILAALMASYAALTWASYVRSADRRARWDAARAEARRLAPVCEADLKPEYRSRGMIIERLAEVLMARGLENSDELAADAVGEMMAKRHKLGAS